MKVTSNERVVCGMPENGGIGFRVLILIVTLCSIGVLITVMLKNYERRQLENHRKAEQISLYGLQAALEKIGKDPSWDEGFEKTSYKEGWYGVSLRRFFRHDSLFVEITSEGHQGDASDAKTYILARVPQHGDSGWVPHGIR